MRDYIQPSARKVGINKKMSWHTSHVLDVAQGQWRGCESRARTFETLNGQDDAGHRCTRGKYRTLAIHTCEPARQRAHAFGQTPAFAIAQRARRKVEALFAELKNLHRTAPTETAPDALCTRAVLLGGNSAEPETAGAVPQRSADSRDRNCMNVA